MNDYYPLLTLISLTLFVGLLCYLVIKSRTKNENIETYALGSKSFSSFSVALSIAASLTSAATFIINPGFIALYGISAYLAFGVVMPLAIFVALIVLMKRFRQYGINVKSLTIADWVGKRYGSTYLKIFFGLLSTLLITFIVLICVGITKVLSKALDADELTILIVLVVVVFSYMLAGGANSMVYTNSLQAVMMIVVAIILLGSGAEYFISTGGEGILERLGTVDPNLTKTFNTQSPLFRDFFEVVVCNAIVGIAIVCQPHILTKSLLIKKDAQVNMFLVYSIIILIVFFSVVITGFYARLSFPDLIFNGELLKMDGIIPAYVVDRFPIYIGILVILGLIAAGLSTLEGLIQAIPTTLTNDLIVPILGEYKKGIQAIQINWLVTFIVAVASILLSYQQLVSPSLSVGIFAQNGVYAFFSAAFVPVFFGIFTKTTNPYVPIVASLVAVMTHFGIYYLELTPYMEGATVKNPAIASAFAIMASTAVGTLIYFIKPMKSPVYAT